MRMKKKRYRLLMGIVSLVLQMGLFTACQKPAQDENESEKTQITEQEGMDTQDMLETEKNISMVNVVDSAVLKTKYEALFAPLKLTESIKTFGMNNPIYTQRFGADPYVISYEGRVYVYMTGDILEKDAAGNVKDNSYSKINTINVFSSDDLVNWTDHGAIYAAGKNGRASWGNNSWAPAVAYKEVDGKMQFFIYFANGGNGIGVLSSDSPTGPFTDPIHKALVSRATPNCADVAWLFDPAVLVDDDGRAYLYFGGGIPNEQYANPGTGRVVELGDDMISLKGEPVALDIPYLFEDSGINKIGDTYYYSYCSNWNVDAEDAKKLGFTSANIVYMTSDSPMGPFTLQGSILKNPGDFFGCYGNNHHCMFEFNGQYYMAYHTQILEAKLGISGGYRCTHIDPVTIREDGSIAPITATKTGVKQVKSFDPYQTVEAETVAVMGGIETVRLGKEAEYFGTGNMAVNEVHSGDFMALYGVDFGEQGAEYFTASIKNNQPQKNAVIELRLDTPNGDVVGYLEVSKTEEEYQDMTTKLLTKVTGKHHVIFIFLGEGYEIDTWKFLH